MINNFRGKYNFLSNMYPAIVEYNNNKYPTVEHAFQAAKSLDTKEQYKVWICATPAEAKKVDVQESQTRDAVQAAMDLADFLM